MNKEIKIIDLLNMIAEGKQAPEKIFYGEQYWINKYPNDYEGLGYGGCLLNNVCLDNLNDEVEIIEEDNNKIEKLNDILRVDDLEPPYDFNIEKIWYQTIKNQNKINEIIDKINNL